MLITELVTAKLTDFFTSLVYSQRTKFSTFGKRFELIGFSPSIPRLKLHKSYSLQHMSVLYTQYLRIVTVGYFRRNLP